MVKLTRIYTKGGDKGNTSLGDGSRVAKHSARIGATGTVDEANSTIGVARLYAEGYQDLMLERIQHDLFDVGADLCTPGETFDDPAQLRIRPKQTERLESEIDMLNGELPALNSFVLPGGGEAGSYLHLARAVVRRAERDITLLAASEPVNPEVLRYINRLSDHLFVLARHLNAKGKGDVLWKPGVNNKEAS
ncbi:MAG: cob(I)yrinic acid a,c-diamide adenosyltransferase [Alphaproteobacteria bacterium]|nr:cob(I)yrinic acid a,c-diamide adenosyltransferase [Alphaproteobacteria bacterium]